MKIKKEELINTVGGVNWSGTMISAVTRLANVVIDIGRFMGSSFRRIMLRKYCL